jgi:hypothetical protein
MGDGRFDAWLAEPAPRPVREREAAYSDDEEAELKRATGVLVMRLFAAAAFERDAPHLRAALHDLLTLAPSAYGGAYEGALRIVRVANLRVVGRMTGSARGREAEVALRAELAGSAAKALAAAREVIELARLVVDARADAAKVKAAMRASRAEAGRALDAALARLAAVAGGA